jgi:hypothetical protein
MVALGETAKQIRNIIGDSGHQPEDTLPIIPKTVKRHK